MAGLLDRLRGKRTEDIELPAEGSKDPRLEKKSPAERVKEGARRYKPKSASLKGLYDALEDRGK